MLKTLKFYFFVSFSLVFCLPVFSQDKLYNHSFQIRPLVYLYNNIIRSISDGDSDAYQFEISFEYQYAINDHIQVFCAPFFAMGNYKNYEFYYSNGINVIEYYYKETSYGITPGVIIRPLGSRLKGFYIKPYTALEIHHINIPNFDFNDTNFTINLMGELGYQWIFRNGFTVALGGGIGNSWILTNKKESYSKTSSLKLDLNFSIGYSF
jgi:hypothetical protein